jgi:hypothetical protein
MNLEDGQGMNLKEIADLLLEPVIRVKRALKDGPELRPLGEAKARVMERRYELQSVVRFVAFYRRWEARQRREKKDRQSKAEKKRYASDSQALLDRARSLLTRASADITMASKLMRRDDASEEDRRAYRRGEGAATARKG